MRVIALYRVSTEKQATEGSSLDAQERTYHAQAAERGWTTVGEFRGCESASQASSDRHVLQQVLSAVRAERPDAIWIIEQSRLTRGDELEVAVLLRELRERRVKLLINGLPRDLGSIDERFMVAIQSLVDRAESDRIKERMHRGKRERARQGKKNSGPAAYGYRNPLKGMPGYGTLEIVEEQARTVRFIFEQRLAGKGEKVIARMLTERSVPPPRGVRWGGTTIRRILQNPLYVGVQASNVWVAERGKRSFRLDLDNERAILVPDAHPAIIDRATWDAVHAMPKQPRTAKPRALTGLLWINGKRGGGNSDGRRYFYTATSRESGQPWLEIEPLEAAVWDAFTSLATSPEVVERLMRQAASAHDQNIVRHEIDHLEDQIGKCKRRLDGLIDMRASGDIDAETFRSKSAKERETLSRLEADLADQGSKAVTVDATLAERVVKAVQTLLAGRTRLTGEQKRAILRSIVSRIDVQAERTKPTFQRDAAGRVRGSGGPAWRIERVTLRLGVPGVGTPHGETSGDGWRNGHEAVGAGEGRTGDLRPTFSGCAQLAGGPPGDRAGQLRPSFSCSARPAPARR